MGNNYCYRAPDFAAAEVLADALASARGRLYDLTVEGKALKTDFSLELMPHAGLGFATAAFPRGADGDKLLAEMRKVLAHKINNSHMSGYGRVQIVK